MDQEIILSLIILLGVLASIFFINRNMGSYVSDEVKKKHISILLTARVRESFYRAILPIEKRLIQWKVDPTLLNFSGLFFSIISALWFYFGKISYGGWFIFLGGLCDVLDGRIARITGKASSKGAFIDSTLDRYAEIVIYFGLLSHFKDSDLIFVVMASIAGSLMVSYTKARGEGLGVTCNVGLMQRPERLVYLGAASIFTPMIDRILALFSIKCEECLLIFILFFIAILSNITSIYRFVYIVNKLSEKER